ncbi:MAG: hypothetical protein ACOYI8_01420 [Christensenellales bacterium]|jgi:hypothetical protein
MRHFKTALALALSLIVLLSGTAAFATEPETVSLAPLFAMGMDALPSGTYEVEIADPVISYADEELDLTGLSLKMRAATTENGGALRFEAAANGDLAFGTTLAADQEKLLLAVDGMKNALTLNFADLAEALPDADLSFDGSIFSMLEDLQSDPELIAAFEAFVDTLEGIPVEPKDLGTQEVEMLYGTYTAQVSEIAIEPEVMDSVLNAEMDLLEAIVNNEAFSTLFIGLDLDEVRAQLDETIMGKLNMHLTLYTAENGSMELMYDILFEGESIAQVVCIFDSTADGSESTGQMHITTPAGGFVLSGVFKGDLPFADGETTKFTAYSYEGAEFDGTYEAYVELVKEPYTVTWDTADTVLTHYGLSVHEGDTETFSGNVLTGDAADGRSYTQINAAVPGEESGFVLELSSDKERDENGAASTDVLLTAYDAAAEYRISTVVTTRLLSDTSFANVDTSSLNLIDAMKITNEDQQMLMEELQAIAMAGFMKLGTIPAIAALTAQ